MTVVGREEVDQRGSAYRTYLAVSDDVPDGFLENVEDQLAVWLRTKKQLDLDVRHDNDLTVDGASVSVTHHEGGHGKRELMATLVENTPIGQWRTELLGSSHGWIDLSVTNAEGRFASVPNLAKYLLGVLPVGDGACALSPEPRLIHPGNVDEVIDAVFDRSRRGLVFVCGTSHKHGLFDAFSERVPRWTREVHGLGQVFLLTPEATDVFNRASGVFGALPFSIRTYYPSVDREDLQDQRRHRYLTTASLARLSDDRIAKLLGTIARSHAATRVDSPHVIRARRAFERLETNRLSDAVLVRTEAPADETQVVVEPLVDSVEQLAADADTGLIRLVKQVLGIPVVTKDELLQRLARERSSALESAQAAVRRVTLRLTQQEEKIWRLEDEAKAALELLEDAAVDESDLRDRAEGLEAEVAWLRQRLQGEGDHEGAFTPREAMDGVESEAFAGTLLDVVTALQKHKLPHVVFCGAEDPVEHVVSVDTLGNAARAAWEVCRALDDYARVVSEGEFSGSVEHYLKNLPKDCRGVPTKKHARGETEATMNQFGADRIFPVPASVDASERVTMEAHFKLASIGMVSPRLYYFDRAQAEGKMYIGYIGKHLRNTQTN
ncbi:hypothetical protein ACTHQ1_04300 [Janibacter anophelis]|uniref:hypothetical protein n=1 Tax=Janibacter anophelis TaxID=319054 RepID=UPI003F7FC91F